MAETAFPLDGIEYYAKDMRAFHAGRTAGIFARSASSLRVRTLTTDLGSSSMSVVVDPGEAYILAGTKEAGGVVYTLDEAVTFTVDSQTGSAGRWDYISIKYDGTANTCKLTYTKSSTKPTPERTTTTYEIILGYFYVDSTTAGITASDIVDTRYSEDFCGVVTDSVAKLSTDAFQSEFDGFMEKIKDNLDGDTAGKLSNRIETLEARQDFKYAVGTDEPTTETCPDGYFYFQLES